MSSNVNEESANLEEVLLLRGLWPRRPADQLVLDKSGYTRGQVGLPSTGYTYNSNRLNKGYQVPIYFRWIVFKYSAHGNLKLRAVPYRAFYPQRFFTKRNWVGRLTRQLILMSRMFLGLPDPDPLVICTDSDPDPSIIKQKY